MKKTFFFLVVASFVFATQVCADDTYENRRTFREDMANEARSDYSGFQQLSDERRDLLRQGWSAEQIRSKQQAEYNARRLPPEQQSFGESSFTPPPAGTNASFSGFSTPQTRKRDAPAASLAVPEEGN